MARQVFFGGRNQPIPQQLVGNPQSVFAAALLNRGGRFNRNERGSGILNAGQNILGALLARQAFEKQEAKDTARAKSQGELIKALFKDQTKVTQEAIPAGEGLPDVDERIFRADVAPPIQESDVGSGIFQRSQTPQGDPQPFASGNAIVNQPSVPVPGDDSLPFSSAGGDFLQVGQQFTQPQVGEIAIPEQTEQVANPNRVLLEGLLKAQGGPLDQSIIPNVALQQQQFRRQDAIAAQQAQAKLDAAALKFQGQKELKNLDITSRELVSGNQISSKKEINRLNREAKDGERIKVNVLLGNDKQTGRPITRIGFAKKNDPSDIKFIGKKTISGSGTQVNVSNLPQIPSALLTGITQSNLALKSVGRIEEIMGRIDIDKFVGPIDSRIGDVLEAVGAPNKDQQTIGNITKDLTDSLGRMRSGGVISDQEWETFMALVPQRTDNFQTFVNKLNDFKAKMSDIRGVNLDATRTFGFNTGTSDDDVSSMTEEQLKALGAE